jgi:hypothetical protein
LKNIEQQIRELSPGEFSELREWLPEQVWKGRDAQIAADSLSGKLDELISEAQAD